MKLAGPTFICPISGRGSGGRMTIPDPLWIPPRQLTDPRSADRGSGDADYGTENPRGAD